MINLNYRSINFVTFREVRLSMDSNDRILWCFSESNQIIILTANRNMKVIREENTLASLPVVTISDIKRLDEFNYRERCVDCMIEIVLNLENYKGLGRLFIP